MPLVSASDPRVIEMGRLRKKAAHHKREMYAHREALRDTKAQLAALEHADPTQPHVTGEGVIHGHRSTDPAS